MIIIHFASMESVEKLEQHLTQTLIFLDYPYTYDKLTANIAEYRCTTLASSPARIMKLFSLPQHNEQTSNEIEPNATIIVIVAKPAAATCHPMAPTDRC